MVEIRLLECDFCHDVFEIKESKDIVNVYINGVAFKDICNSCAKEIMKIREI